ncbi:response regulator transcription factor [Panacibacter sp. DH6]|uniref:Response regulator transcription factor n=1 Tax=Panacibacter microcysteis TaxID=2793269 RepID=A0A931GYD5_9BACT|nr:LytTR family DNA-binding domain-containing protein [Panacibacter microcysteis]MBG9375432.1 response regulator transcription factor [Panacibacter microcysteis]
MLNAVIIEDETSGIERLRNILTELVPDINISAVISSVKDGITYFSTMPRQDIIFCDIHLTDGLSFEIFNNFKVDSPIIFTTAFDEFLMTAFDYNSIDYLLKPLNSTEVLKAIQKYRLLQQHFSQHAQRLNNLMEYLGTPKKTRLIVKKGLEHIAVRMEDIVLLYTENKVVYLIDRNRCKYIYDKNLSISEAALDPGVFFRANRKYIVNINYIKSYRAFEKVKLQVDFSIADIHHQVIISQETAPDFRKWLSGE